MIQKGKKIINSKGTNHGKDQVSHRGEKQKETAKTTKQNVWVKKTSEGHQMSENWLAEIDHIDLKHALASVVNSHG